MFTNKYGVKTCKYAAWENPDRKVLGLVRTVENKMASHTEKKIRIYD